MAQPREARRLEVEVPEALDGERVDRVVALVADRSRREANALIERGAVTVDGKPPGKSSDRLTTGATIVMYIPEQADPLAPAPQIEVPIVFEDASVLVVDKPAGLVVHPGAGVPGDTMIQALLASHPDIANAGGEADRPGIVHRLDRPTSGLLMVARTEAARSSLVDQLADRSVTRHYLALAWGIVEANEGLIDAPLGRSPRDATRRAVVVGGRPARTRYRVLERLEDADITLLECRLETGRTHQIRAHLEAIGHPVVGDQRYAPRRSTLGLGRLFLHAAELGFDHPTTGERMHFESPLPADLADLLVGLREGTRATSGLDE